MGVVGIIGGTVFFKEPFSEAAKEEMVNTRYGLVKVYRIGNLLFLSRHGINNNVPPHKIEHHANLHALKNLHAERIIGVGSAGSLRPTVAPGSLAVPRDFISFFNIPTRFDSEIQHITPSFDEKTRADLMHAASVAGIPVLDRGVYFQTTGPRLETKAEVDVLSKFAHFVGMTIGSEAALACEMEIPYAALCSVDNFAHGVEGAKPDIKEIGEHSRKNANNIKRILFEYAREKL